MTRTTYIRWTPEQIRHAVDLASTCTCAQIARALKVKPTQVRSLLDRLKVKPLFVCEVDNTPSKVSAMIGIAPNNVVHYIITKKLSADVVGRRRRGDGARYDIDMTSLYDLARTPLSLGWRITDDTPPDLAAIMNDVARQWIHNADVVAACPVVFTNWMPWQSWSKCDYPTPTFTRLDHGHVYYLRSSLYEVMYNHIVKNLPRNGIKADWLGAIYDSWHGTFIVTKDLNALDIDRSRDLRGIPRHARGVFRRSDLVRIFRQRGRDDLAKAVLGSEMHYLDLMKPEDRP